MTTPVLAELSVEADEPRRTATVTLTVGADEPVFAGHYQHFAIFPGVCLVDCVVRGADRTIPDPGLELCGVDSARFLTAVFPGDEVRIELSWRPLGDDWRCAAELSTARGPAAVVRLRYRVTR